MKIRGHSQSIQLLASALSWKQTMPDQDKKWVISFTPVTFVWPEILFLQWVDGLRAVVENLSTQDRSPLPPREHLAAFDCLIACRKQLHDTELANAKLVQMIENFQGGSFNHNDSDMLMLKALSSATTSTLSVGLTHLQKYQEATRAEMY